MKRILILGFLLTFCTISFAAVFDQKEDNEILYDTLHLFEKDQITFVLFDSINIRKTASLQGEIITKLNIGAKVRVVGKSPQCSYLNGVTIPWYKIEFGKNQVGYIWGGKLALASEKSAKNIHVIFLFGIEKAGSDQLYYTIKALKNQKEISSFSFKGYSRITKEHRFELISNKGLENVDDILNVHAYGQFCGDDAGQFVFFWSNEKIQFVDMLDSGFDAPHFYNETFIYPSDSEGEKGVIYKHISSGEYLDDLVDDWNNPAIKYDQDDRIKFKWNGYKLIEQK